MEIYPKKIVKMFRNILEMDNLAEGITQGSIKTHLQLIIGY